MKILVVTGPLVEMPDANTKIALTIVDEFRKLGNTCHVLASYKNPAIKKQYGNELYHLFRLPKEYTDDLHIQQHFAQVKDKQMQLLRKVMVLIAHPVRTAKLMLSGGWLKRNTIDCKYQKEIVRAAKKNHYDAIVSVYFPPYILKASSKLASDLPVYLYQLDPWTFSEAPTGIDSKERREQELEAFSKARHIFTTPVLLQQYQSDSEFSSYVSKMTALEFPTFICSDDAKMDSPIAFSRERTNLLYAGTLSDEYRNPDYLVALFSRMLDQKNDLSIYFMSGQHSKKIIEFEKRYPDSVFLVSRQTPELARQAMIASDILINIGNSLFNQMPSKLLEYFSTGKPVICTSKFESDIAKGFMQKYPLGLMIREYESIDVAGKELRDFISEVRDKRLGSDVVEKLFYECSPKFVAEKMISVIKRGDGREQKT